MAIDKQKLSIDIEANTGDAQKNVKKLSNEIDNLDQTTQEYGKTTSKSEKALLSHTKKMELLARGLKSANLHAVANAENFAGIDTSSKKAAMSVNSLAKSFIQSSQMAEQLSDSVGDLNKENQKNSSSLAESTKLVGKSFSVVNRILLTMARVVDAVTDAYGTFIDILEMIGDTKRIKKIVRVLRLLSMLAKMRGFERVSKGLSFISDSLLDVSIKASMLSDRIERDFNRIMLGAELLNLAVKSLSATAVTVGGILVLSVINGLVQGFLDAAAAVGLANKSMRVLTDISLKLENSFEKTNQTVKNLNAFMGRGSTVGAKRYSLLEDAILRVQIALRDLMIETKSFGKTILDVFKSIGASVPLIIKNIGEKFVATFISAFGLIVNYANASIKIIDSLLMGTFDKRAQVALKALIGSVAEFGAMLVRLFKSVSFDPIIIGITTLGERFSFVRKTILDVQYIMATVNLNIGNLFKNIKSLNPFLKVTAESWAALGRAFSFALPGLMTLLNVVLDLMTVASTGFPMFTTFHLAFSRPGDIDNYAKSLMFLGENIKFRLIQVMPMLRKQLDLTMISLKSFFNVADDSFKALPGAVQAKESVKFGDILRRTLSMVEDGFRQLAISARTFLAFMRQSMNAGIQETINLFMSLNKVSTVGAKRYSRLEDIILRVRMAFKDLNTQLKNSARNFLQFSNIVIEKSKVIVSQFINKFVNPAIKFVKEFGFVLRTVPSEAFSFFIGGLKSVLVTMNPFSEAFFAFGKGFKRGFTQPLINGFQILKSMSITVAESQNKFKTLAQVLSQVLAPSIVTAAKLGTSFGPILTSLGIAAFQSENAVIKLAGAITFVLSLAFVTLGTVITLLLDKIGRFIEAIGDTLIDAISRYEEKAKKAQAATKLFQFTIEGFNRVLGEEAVGSLDMWNEKITELSDNTIFASGVIRKSVKLLVSEGSSLHLTVSQMTDVLERAADISAVTGKQLDDVTQRLISGMQGQSQAVLALGLNLSEHTLFHSKLAKEMKISAKSGDENAKIQLRLAEAFKQSEPMIGAAAEQLNTVAGASAQLEKTISSLQTVMGAQSTATVAYTSALSKLGQIILSIPGPILKIVASFADLSGVVLKVVGIFAQYFLIISSLGVILRVLNGLLAGQGILANSLNKIFGFLVAKLSVYDASLKKTIVTNTSLNAVMMNTVRIIKAGIIATLKELIVSIGVAQKKVMAFTASLIANPLFFKAVAIAGAIYLVVTAMNDFREEITAVIDIIPGWIKLIMGLVAAYYALVNVLKIAAIQNLVFVKSIRATTAALAVSAAITAGTAKGLMFYVTAVKLAAGALLTKLKVAVAAVSKAVSVLTAKVLLNPIFLGTALIVSGIVAIGQALIELRDEFGLFTELIGDNTKEIEKNKNELGFFAAAWLALKDTILGVFIAAKELSKFMIVGVIGTFLLFERTYLRIKSRFQSGIGLERTKKEIGEITKEIKHLGGISRVSLGRAVDAITGTNIALGETDKLLKKLNRQFSLLDINQVDLLSVQMETLGNEFDKAVLKAERAGLAYNKLWSKVRSGVSLTDEEEEKLKKSRDDRAKAYFEIQKLQNEVFTKFNEIQKQARINELKENKDLIEIARMENAERLKQFNKEVEGLKTLGISGQNRLKMVEKTRKAINLLNKVALDSAKKQMQAMKFGDLEQQFDDMMKKTRDLEKQNDSFGKNRIQAIEAAYQANLREIDLLDKRLALTDQLAGKEGEIARMRQAAGEGKQVEEQKAKVDMSGEVGQVGTQLAGMFGDLGSVMGESMGGVMSSISSSIMSSVGSMASSIIGLILKAPAILDMVSNLINEVTNWPKALSKAISGFIDAIVSSISDFLPNLINSIGDILMNVATALADTIPDAITGLLESVPDLLVSLMERLPEIAVKFGEALVKMDPTIIAIKFMVAIIKALPRLIKAFVNMIPEIIKGFVKGISEAIRGLGGYLLGDNLAEKVNESFKKLATNITNATSQLFAVADLENARKQKAQADQISQQMQDGAQKMLDLLRKWWSELEKVWKSLWTWGVDLWRKFWTGLVEMWRAVWNVVSTIWEGIKNGVMAIAEGAKKILGDLAKGIQHGILELAKVFGKFWEKAQEFGTELWSFITELVASIVNLGKVLLESLIEGGNSIVNGLVRIVTDFSKGLIHAVNEAIRVFSDGLNALASWFSEQGTAIWNSFNAGLVSLGNWFSEKGTAIWNSFNAGLVSLGNWFSEKGTAIWHGLQAGLISLGNWFLNRGNDIWIGLNNGLDSLAGWFYDMGKRIADGLTDFLPDLSIGGGGGGGGGLLGGSVIPGVLNKGGIIPGNAAMPGDSILNDKILAFLSPGEAVIPRSLMENTIFGKLVKAILQGTLNIQNFANGGMVAQPAATLAPIDFGGLSGRTQTVGGGTVTNNFNFQITIETTTEVDEDFVRTRFFPTLKEELRRDSLDGRRVIETTGIG